MKWKQNEDRSTYENTRAPQTPGLDHYVYYQYNPNMYNVTLFLVWISAQRDFWA